MRGRVFVDGPLLIMLYRFSVQGGQLLKDELASFVGAETVDQYAIVLTFGCWCLFGVLARMYCEATGSRAR